MPVPQIRELADTCLALGIPKHCLCLLQDCLQAGGDDAVAAKLLLYLEPARGVGDLA